MQLTQKQTRLIETAGNGVPPSDRERFEKYIGDILRGILGQPTDTDTWIAVQEALRRYAESPTQH